MPFDQWSLQDKAKWRRDFEENYGPTFTPYSNDPALRHKQIEAKVGPLSNYAKQDPMRLMEEVGTGAGGGGSTPAWVPANAKIHIDLVGNRAWTEDDGIIEVDTLLGSDPNTENAWSETGYDPTNLMDDGYKIRAVGDPPGSIAIGIPPAFIGAARSRVLSGSTLRYQTKILTGGADRPSEELLLVSANGDGAVEFFCFSSSSALDGSSWGGSFHVRSVPVFNTGVVGLINVSAYTATPTRAEAAVNGWLACNTTLDETDWPTTGDGAIAAVLIDIGSVNALQSITIYDALPSTAGLAALTDIGVTNTAPTGIDITWSDLGGEGNSDGTYSRAFIGMHSNIATFAVVDPEGNPAVYTLAEDVSGYFAITGNSLDCISSLPDPGEYDFTVRATDPGGLYAEQEFTITVTA